jgi:cyclin-dependent kinase
MSIFKALGTPTPEVYPKIVELPQYRDDFPKYPGKDLSVLVPGLEEEAYDLLRKLLQYDPSKRPTAAEAIEHPYLATARAADREKSKK